MSSRKVLVVFYSRSGTTRTVAEAIARSLDADLEEIRDTINRGGVFGYVRSAIDARLGRSTTLESQLRDPGDYGLVLIGTPVWFASVCAPARTYLQRNKSRFHDVAFFLTEGGRGAERVFAQMTRIVGKEPTATLALKQRDVARAIAPTTAFLAALGTSSNTRVDGASPHAPPS